MQYLVAYDISSARTRRYAVKWCKQAGLRRMQKSLFAGEGLPALIKTLEKQLIPMLGKNDRLCVMPLDAGAWKTLKLTGNTLTKEMLGPSSLDKYF